MNRDEFLAALRETPRRGWYVTKYGAIRRRRLFGLLIPDCPITAVKGGCLLGFGAFLSAGRALGLSAADAGDVACVADKLVYDPALRAALLDATVRRTQEGTR